jgi:DNA-binding CsgD family transcriptional regulator
MPRPHTCILTARQRKLRDMLLSPASGRLICRTLDIKPSQLANMSKDVYRKLGYTSRVQLMGYELHALRGAR